MKHLVTYNGKTYVFVKEEPDEVYSHFVNRVWWLVKTMNKYPKNQASYLYNMSYIWSNVYHHGVVYDKNIMDELITLE